MQHNDNSMSQVINSHEQLILPETPIFNMNFDVLLYFLSFLDPLSLYYISRTSNFFKQLAESEPLWERHSLQHFPDAIPKNGMTTRYVDFFKLQSMNYYKNFGLCDKSNHELFALVRANDLQSIKQRCIQFSCWMLEKTDNMNFMLIELIRQHNNISLNEYIFNKIYDGYQAYGGIERSKLIECGIRLDQPSVVALMKEEFSLNHVDFAQHFVCAIQWKSSRVVERLLQDENDPVQVANLKTIQGYPIHLAVKSSCLLMVKLLLHYGAQIDSLDANDHTVLYLAARNGKLELVKYLAEQGANINAQHTMTSFPLYAAIEEQQNDIVSFLLNKHADINLKYNGYSLLYIAAETNNLIAVQLLVTHCVTNKINFNINEKMSDSSTALYIAAENGHDEMVKLLLTLGAETEIVSYHFTPLCIAVKRGHLNVVNVLCNHGANIHFADHEGFTPINIAAYNGHSEIVQYLASVGAHIEHRNQIGNTPFFTACSRGFLGLAKTLYDLGANINTRNNLDWTPLYVASMKGFFEIIKFLFEKGVTPNDIMDYSTPLHIFCMHNNDYGVVMYGIKLFLRAGVNFTKSNMWGQKASQVARLPEIGSVLSTLELLSLSFKELPVPSNCNDLNISSIIDSIKKLHNDEQYNATTLSQQLDVCLKYLCETSTSFGCAVVLYALVNIDWQTIGSKRLMHYFFACPTPPNNSNFVDYITKLLGFQNQSDANDFLSLYIKQCLGYNAGLLNDLTVLVINEIKREFDDNASIPNWSFHRVILILNLFETHIKKMMTVQPAEQLDIPNQSKMKM